jgi:hypothetical protein
VLQTDFEDALLSCRTSIQPEELARYTVLRESFEGTAASKPRTGIK